MDSVIIAVIVGIVILVYVPIMMCSTILNGIIVVVYAMAKQLHTPSNLLQVHLSAVGLIIPFFYSPFTLLGFLSALLQCNCTILYYHWLFGNVLHFGVYPFSILLLSISYFLILKFKSIALNFTRVAVGLFLVWIISLIMNLPMFLLTTSNDFIGCCETVCQNGSALCNTSYKQSFTPRLFTKQSKIYYDWRDLFAVIIPTTLVFITSAGSYIIYKRSSIIGASVSLEVRMFLMPIILTFAVGGYIFGHDIINWVDSAITDDRIPGITPFIIFHMLWDSSGVVFATIVLFFNATFQRIFFRLLQWRHDEVIDKLRLTEKTKTSSV